MAIQMYTDMEELQERISRCEDIKELKETILPLLHTQQEQWSNKIQEIIQESGYTKTEFADLCEVSRMAVNKWCRGAIPRTRELYLTIGMVAGYDISQMNAFLHKYGRCPALYERSLEDSICMFVLNQNYGEGTILKYRNLLGRIRDRMEDGTDQESTTLTQEQFREKVLGTTDEVELENFLVKNKAILKTAFQEFYAHTVQSIQKCSNGYAESISDFAVIQGWSSALKQSVSAIRQKKWYPTRNKIILLGIYLSLSREQINEMLGLAQMGPLDVTNIFECILIFILEDAYLKNMLNREAEEYDPNGLARYARGVLRHFDLSAMMGIIEELPGAWEEK